MEQTADIEIESIAAGGDGVGRAGGIVVFTPRTAPGDLARVHLDRRKHFARGELQTVLRASPQRIEPPCGHYVDDRCGGCQLQHIEYDAQLSAKSGIVRDALTRIGKREAPLPLVVASERQWRYRTKLTLAMRSGPSGWVIGLHPYDDPSTVFQLADCPITDERVVASWREIMDAARSLPDAAELRASVRLVGAGAGVAVVVEGGRAWSSAREFFDAVPSSTALWWRPEMHARRLLHERTTTAAGASFGQVNAGVAAALQAHVVGRVLSYEPSTVVDAYAGTGDTAVAIARAGVRVTTIELDRDASARAAERLPQGSRSLHGRVEDLLARALPTDVMLLNPPRGGLDQRVSRALQETPSAPASIVYVSCDPATLGRDVARMPRYTMKSVLAFDMFPQTAHVETVCELVPAAA